ncbi:MAG TPA: HAD family hydrolase [Planctomycetaceae bacterium]|nr:HAD family hydrolase [Planctomycetaceae bacterium]
MNASRRFVLLDRDGTINVERHYLSHPQQLSLLPGAAAGLRTLRELGLGLVVVTNQSGIARGFFDEARLAAIHDRLHELLGGAGVELDGIYFCPHGPDDRCPCRKPREGMALAAARELGFRLEESFMIGDKACDIELGRRIGATTLLVRTGYGAEVELTANTAPAAAPDHVVTNLKSAATVIRRILRGGKAGGHSDRRAA